jgi:hypothetical protein
VWRSSTSDAMGISTLAVRCRGALNACLGNDRGDDEPGRSIAMDTTGVGRRRSKDKIAIRWGARASLVKASREPAKQGPAILPRADLIMMCRS